MRFDRLGVSTGGMKFFFLFTFFVCFENNIDLISHINKIKHKFIPINNNFDIHSRYKISTIILLCFKKIKISKITQYMYKISTMFY